MPTVEQVAGESNLYSVTVCPNTHAELATNLGNRFWVREARWGTAPDPDHGTNGILFVTVKPNPGIKSVPKSLLTAAYDHGHRVDQLSPATPSESDQDAEIDPTVDAEIVEDIPKSPNGAQPTTDAPYPQFTVPPLADLDPGHSTLLLSTERTARLFTVRETSPTTVVFQFDAPLDKRGRAEILRFLENRVQECNVLMNAAGTEAKLDTSDRAGDLEILEKQFINLLAEFDLERTDQLHAKLNGSRPAAKNSKGKAKKRNGKKVKRTSKQKDDKIAGSLRSIDTVVQLAAEMPRRPLFVTLSDGSMMIEFGPASNR